VKGRLYNGTRCVHFPTGTLHGAAASGSGCRRPSGSGAGNRDPALFSRRSGFYLSTYEEPGFSRHEFWVSPEKTGPAEDRRYYQDYYARGGVKIPSGLRVTRNHANTANKSDWGCAKNRSVEPVKQ